MRRINTFMLYSLGKELTPLHKIKERDAKYRDVMFQIFDARIQVNALLANDILSVRTCRQAAGQLVEAMNRVVPDDIDAAFQKDRDSDVNWWALRQIKDAVQKFETVLAEELNLIDTYAVAQKGAYSTPELVSNAEVMFSKIIQEKLPPLAVHDIREAGKCLAFETPTAAAFHIVRAIESVILAYFSSVLNRQPPTRMRNWGIYIKAIRDSGRGDAKILDFLEHIKNNYRNPVSHPEAVLTVEEVLVLLGVAVGAITQMALAL